MGWQLVWEKVAIGGEWGKLAGMGECRVWFCYRSRLVSSCVPHPRVVLLRHYRRDREGGETGGFISVCVWTTLCLNPPWHERHLQYVWTTLCVNPPWHGRHLQYGLSVSREWIARGREREKNPPWRRPRWPYEPRVNFLNTWFSLGLKPWRQEDRQATDQRTTDMTSTFASIHIVSMATMLYHWWIMSYHRQIMTLLSLICCFS